MLDIGWYELLVVAVITVLIVGPKELPRVLRTVTQFTRKLRSMASEFQSGIDDLAREAELDDLKKTIEDTASRDLEDEIESALDPTGEFTDSVREIGDSIKEEPKAAGPDILNAPVDDPAPKAPAKKRKKTSGVKTKAASTAKRASKSASKRASKSGAKKTA